jgi:hypothetical protein
MTTANKPHQTRFTAAAVDQQHNLAADRQRQGFWARLQQPGDHWFFLLYLGGLGALFVLVGLLKLGMRLL